MLDFGKKLGVLCYCVQNFYSKDQNYHHINVTRICCSEIKAGRGGLGEGILVKKQIKNSSLSFFFFFFKKGLFSCFKSNLKAPV